MADLGWFDLLKPFPLLQLAAGLAVVIVVIYLTVRGAKDNKRDGHIAPQGHDPLGMTVMANIIVGHLSVIAESSRRQASTMDDLRIEQVKTNARLAEIKDAHASEMEHLREEVRRERR